VRTQHRLWAIVRSDDHGAFPSLALRQAPGRPPAASALERSQRRAAHADRRYAQVADDFRRNGRRMETGDPLTIGDNAQGYPRASLKDVPAGDYTIQAVLNVYETFHRSTARR
jgi:hypothetical protein